MNVLAPDYPRRLVKITGVLSEDRFECTIITCGNYQGDDGRKILTSNNHQITRMLEAEYKSGVEVLIYVSGTVIIAVGSINIRW